MESYLLTSETLGGSVEQACALQTDRVAVFVWRRGADGAKDILGSMMQCCQLMWLAIGEVFFSPAKLHARIKL